MSKCSCCFFFVRFDFEIIFYSPLLNRCHVCAAHAKNVKVNINLNIFFYSIRSYDPFIPSFSFRFINRPINLLCVSFILLSFHDLVNSINYRDTPNSCHSQLFSTNNIQLICTIHMPNVTQNVLKIGHNLNANFTFFFSFFCTSCEHLERFEFFDFISSNIFLFHDYHRLITIPNLRSTCNCHYETE